MAATWPVGFKKLSICRLKDLNEITIESDETFSYFIVRGRPHETTDQKVAQRNDQNAHKQQLSFGLPFHADGHDAGQDDERGGSDDADVVFAVVDDLDALLDEQVVERFAETDRVQWHGHGVGQGENDADGATEFWAQRSTDHVVSTT